MRQNGTPQKRELWHDPRMFCMDMNTRFISKVFFAMSAIWVLGCSTPAVRSTVDSFGDRPIDRGAPHVFERAGPELLEQQATESCATAAKQAAVNVFEGECKDCVHVRIGTRLVGTQQVIRTSPGWGGSYGMWGPNSAVGVGYSEPVTSAYQEAGREITLQFFQDKEMKRPIREIQVRSVGPENSVIAVAHEMCLAAFKEYPLNLAGAIYEIDVPKEVREH